MSTNALLFAILFILVAIAAFVIIRVELRLKKLFRGSKAGTLEKLIAELTASAQNLADRADGQSEEIAVLRKRLEKQGHSVKLVRFNPFKEVGGNHSFAVAIVNEEGDGVVFSSLYSRERMSVFAKPLSKGTSDVELTPEEVAVAADATKEAKA